MAGRARVAGQRARGAGQRMAHDATQRWRERTGRDEIIYLVAPAGHPNYGDELIVRTWLRYLAQVRPHATVVVDCHSPGQACLYFQDDHPRVLFVDTLWQLTIYADRDLPDDVGVPPWEWVADSASRLGGAPRLAEGVDLLRRASTVHLVGGGYLNALWPGQVSLVTGAAAVARSTGARVVATGHGLTPVFLGARGDAFLTAASAFELFDVRDAASLEVLAGVPGARCTGDDVWLAVPDVAVPCQERHAGPLDGVALCVQADLVGDFRYAGADGVAALAGFVRDTLDAWEVPGDQVTVVEGIPGRDYEVPELLGDRLAGATVVPFLDVWRLGMPVGAGRTWLGTRFHPHLVAAAAGDSGVAIVPKPDYYATKHASLTAAGSKWTVVGGDGEPAVPPRPTAGGFSAVDRERNVAAKAALAAELYPRRRLL